MAMTSVSRSAFSRTGTVLTMKPGVTTLSVGTIDVTGITIDENYSIDVTKVDITVGTIFLIRKLQSSEVCNIFYLGA